MRISVLTIGAIASIITTATFANQVLTSQTYVDNQDALKQNKIPATGTNSSTPGSTVVTYTSTAGTIGERGIFDFGTGWDDSNKAIVSGHETDLLEARRIVPGLFYISDALTDIQDNMPDFNDLPTTTVTYKTCTRWVDNAAHTDANCLLWNLTDKTVYGNECTRSSDCAWLDCPAGSGSLTCSEGHCSCIPFN